MPLMQTYKGKWYPSTLLMWHAAHPLSGFDPRCLRYIHLSDGQKVVSKTANEGSIPSGCAPLFSLLTGTNRVGDARLSVTSFEKGISGSRTQNSLRCVLTIPSGFPRKRKQISKGFLPAGNPGSPVYDLYMIHIAPSPEISKKLRELLKNLHRVLLDPFQCKKAYTMSK